MPDVKDFIRLPYDFELKDDPLDTDAIQREYEQARANFRANWN